VDQISHFGLNAVPLLETKRGLVQKVTFIKGCPAAAITPIYLYTPKAQVVEDYGFTKNED
jgi:hypothetical protein